MTQDRGPNMGEMDLQVPDRQHLQPGQVVRGTVVHISESHVFLDLGHRTGGVIPGATQGTQASPVGSG